MKELDFANPFVSWPIAAMIAGAPLPGDLYMCIRQRLIRYRGQDDVLTSDEYDKLLLNKVQYVFVKKDHYDAFVVWHKDAAKREEEAVWANVTTEQKPVVESIQGMRRGALDLFIGAGWEKEAKVCVDSAKSMVTELLKKPYIIDRISLMQRFGHGVVDHSVNVSVLSTFLGLQMGYSSQNILENLAIAGLLHDVGKALVKVDDDMSPELRELAMQSHPIVGRDSLDGTKLSSMSLGSEVPTIIAQHHEFLDGTGYPQKVQALAIYDLTRIVTIANIYDNLVTEQRGDLKARQEQALKILESDYKGKLDRKKLEKAVKCLRSAQG